MYTPKKYKNENLDELKQFIRTHSFGMLVTHDGDKPLATHIPIELKTKNKKDYLIGHISKANPQWNTFNDQKEVLCIFTAHHSYISASWYSVETVSTWNYIAVHAYGKIRIVNEKELHQSLEELMSKYEKGSENPLHLKDVNQDKVQKMMKGIVGFEIEITKLEANYKLSQNRNDKDYENIITELEKKTDPNSKKIAEEMKNRRNTH